MVYIFTLDSRSDHGSTKIDSPLNSMLYQSLYSYCCSRSSQRLLVCDHSSEVIQTIVPVL